MRLLTAIYAVLALAFCLWLGFNWKQALDAEPRTLLDEARRSMSGPEVDYRRALLELGSALEAAETARDLPLVEEILTTRAELLRRTGGYAQARADLERVLTHFRPGSLAVEALLAGVDLDAGEVESALARSTRVIERERGQADAWGVRADALLKLAERKLQSARAKAGFAATAGSEEPADVLLRRIAVLDPSDPARTRRVDELFALFPSGDKDVARDVIEELDDASRMFAAVPEALAESLRGAVRRDSLVRYVKLLQDAGESDAAAEFGLCVARMPWLSGYPPFLRDLMELLLATGRVEPATEIVPGDLGKRAAPDASFFGMWSVVLYRAERWRELVPIANHLRQAGEPDQKLTANFYLGVAHWKLGRADEAKAALQRYVTRPPVEPFRGALALAWRTLAEVYRAADELSDELAALRHCTASGDDQTPGMGAVWERIAELSWSQPGGNRHGSIEDLTHALRLSPERRAELEPTWALRGQQVADAMRVDISAELDALAERGLSFPEGRRTGYELVRMAEESLARGDPATALSIARRTLLQFPGLLPALEAQAAAQSASGDRESAIDTLREIIARAGPDEERLSAILRLGAAELDGARRAELVRLDPEGLGRRWAAEDLRDRGQVGEAIAGLQRVPASRLGDEGNLLLAQMLYGQGQYERAQVQLARLSAELAVLARALPLAIDIGVAKRDAAHVLSLLRVLEAKVEIDTDALLGCVDHMLRAEMLDCARALVGALDRRARWRSGALFVREAQIEMLSGDLGAAREALERAIAYDEDGAGELGLVLLAVEQREWSELPSDIAEFRASGNEPSPIQYVVQAALGERLLEARAASAAASAALEEPDRTLWQLVGGALAALDTEAAPAEPSVAQWVSGHGFGAAASGALERDPRRLLARLLALGHPEWTSWAIADLSRSTPPASGALWPTYLAAVGHAWLGDSRAAEASARSLIESWPTFVPAWDMVELAVTEDVRRPDHPRVIRLLEQRRAALGEQGVRSADLAIAEARLAEQRGDLDAALAAARRAVAAEPQRAAAQRRLAQVLRKRQDWSAALAAFRASLERAESETDNHPVREFLSLCEEARTQGGAPLERPVRLELDFLSTRFPGDPLPALAQARAALREAADDPRGGITRVRGLLQDLRVRTGQVPLEELRAGSAVEWAELLAEFDPEDACELLESELLLTPASVELWRALARASERVGQLSRAIEAAETAVRMLPDADTARRLAVLCARRGDSLESVQLRIDEAQRLSGSAAEDRALTLASVRSLLRGNRARLGEAIGVLARLWQSRDAVARPDELVEVGTLYGFALCRRGDAADRNTAIAVLQEVRPRVTDPTQRNLLLALSSLARFLGA